MLSGTNSEKSKEEGTQNDTLVPLQSEEKNEPEYLHETTKRFMQWRGGIFSWVPYIPLWGRALQHFGPNLVLSLNFSQLLTKGICNKILYYSFLPMFLYRFECDAAQYQRLFTVGGIGWSMKPLVALLSDNLAFFGYRRRWMLAFFAFLGVFSSLGYSFLPAGNHNANYAVGFYAVANYCIANIDILKQGLFSRKIRYVTAGVFLLASMEWMMLLGDIIGAFIQGPLTDQGHERVGGFVAAGCFAVSFPIFFFNHLEEDRNEVERIIDFKERQIEIDQGLQWNPETVNGVVQPNNEESTETSSLHAWEPCFDSQAEEPVNFFEERTEVQQSELSTSSEEESNSIQTSYLCSKCIEFNSNVWNAQYRLVIFCFVMTIVMVAQAFVTILSSTFVLMAFVFASALGLSVMLFWALPPVIAKVGLFSLFNHALYLNINGLLNSFYAADSQCVPDGPNFDFFFLYSISAAIGGVAAIIGVTAFPYVFCGQPYRLAFLSTGLFRIATSVFDLILVNRWNKALGISDHLFYVLCGTVIYQVFDSLSRVPMRCLISHLCSRGSEAMVYAVVAAMGNLGNTVSSQMTSFLLEILWPISNTPSSCNYQNLWKYIVLGHMLLPSLLCFLIFVWIPKRNI